MEPPRLAYEARYVIAQPTGIGQLCLELLRGLAELSPGLSMTVLIDDETSLPAEILEAKHLTFLEIPWKIHGIQNQIRLPWLLKKLGIRVLHNMDVFSPVMAFGIRHIVNIHDLIPLTCSDQIVRSKKVKLLPLFRTWLKLQCMRAEFVVTGSQYSAGDIMNLLRVSPEKIHVIHDSVRKWDEKEPIGEFKKRMGVEGKIISYAGRHDPYKNITGLIRAMPKVKALYPERIQLIIAGNIDSRYPEAKEEVRRLGLKDQVLFPGYLTEKALGALYNSSDVFVFPSFYEGFGMPPLEAMSFGIPVVASNRASLPEILGDAALYIDPDNPASIAEGILRVLNEPDLASYLRKKGLERVNQFSTSTFVTQYVKLYQSLLDQNP